jgi:tRNA threonylcarbamoyladenosine biosynthesis protein TsaB
MTARDWRPVILALDTAGLACSVAVAVGDRVLETEHIENPHGQAEALLPMVDAAMRKAGLMPAALDVVAVTVGPGSFTGTRVGLAGARGIVLATSARLIGVTSFDPVVATAIQAIGGRGSYLLVGLESRREDLFVQFFDPRFNPIGGPTAIMPTALGEAVNAAIGGAPLAIAGNAAQRASVALGERPHTTILIDPTPSAVGVWRAARHTLQLGVHSVAPRPLYLRPPDVTVSSGRRQPDRKPV